MILLKLLFRVSIVLYFINSYFQFYFILKNMENYSYYHPPYFSELCKQDDRKKKFKNGQFDYVDCELDPYYPERHMIYKDIFNTLKKQNTQNNFGELKKKWKEIMQKKYQNLQYLLPYEYCEEFISNAKNILLQTNGPQNLIQYVENNRIDNYDPDPFYLFITLYDYLIYELTQNKQINNSLLTQFIGLSIKNKYIGITQMRFYLYMAILFRNVPYFHSLISHIKNNQIKRLLLVESLTFAYINLKIDFVDYILNNYDISFDDIPTKIRDSICYKKQIINNKKILNKNKINLYKKYYNINHCN